MVDIYGIMEKDTYVGTIKHLSTAHIVHSN